ncbi:MAG: Fic family protein [Cyanobacteria bacterium REEB67]|nr:Fic family protein [Cyanobacteria bacterium REEB67]
MFKNYAPSMQVVKLIGEIDEFKGAWKSIANISPERLAILKRVATIESIGSSTRIEGASLSNEAVEKLLAGLQNASLESRDEEEVAGYSDLMEKIFAHWSQIPLTENYLKELHRDLLKYSSRDERHRGLYKTINNNVEARDAAGNRIGIVFETATPFETPFKMTALIDWLDTAMEKRELHDLFVVSVFVVCFLAIHPFQDGNGRLSRCLTTLLLLKFGYHYVPYSSLESIIEANKESYYVALRRTQMTLGQNDPDWEPWILFFLKSMQKQKNKLMEKIERAHILQGELPELSIKILEIVREQGSIKSSELTILTGESRSTLLARINEMLKDGKLSRHGKGPATWYTIPRT